MNKGHEFWQTIVLRGLEGVIGDKFLKTVVESNTGIEELENYFEAKNMSYQVFAQMRGWGL
jgi:hypothetical protein